MGQLERLAIEFHTEASRALGDAVGRFAYIADEGGEFTAEELARAAVAQHVYGWWQTVMDLINGEDAGPADAIMRTRRDAERRLINARPVCHGELFAQAMAQAQRQGAQDFLISTQQLADALTSPILATGPAPAAGPTGFNGKERRG